jgi:hypothetical protein
MSQIPTKGIELHAKNASNEPTNRPSARNLRVNFLQTATKTDKKYDENLPDPPKLVRQYGYTKGNHHK